jgi:hypothetical protein
MPLASLPMEDHCPCWSELVVSRVLPGTRISCRAGTVGSTLILRYFASLKSEAAQARNLDRAMHVLSGQRGRFMAQNWERGR